LIKHNIKTLVIPPGGWHYEQPLDAGGFLRIEGQSFERLEDLVFEFRLSHPELVPTGSLSRESVDADLEHWICSRFPNQCASPSSATPAVSPNGGGPVYRKPIERIQDWFKGLGDKEFADPATANSRSDICAKCPQNIGWRTPCQPCVQAIERQILRVRGSRSTSNDIALEFCRVFGHHNKLAVWLKNTHSSSSHELPAFCWNHT
jgi:hypothetical protein